MKKFTHTIQNGDYLFDLRGAIFTRSLPLDFGMQAFRIYKNCDSSSASECKLEKMSWVVKAKRTTQKSFNIPGTHACFLNSIDRLLEELIYIAVFSLD